MRRGPILQVGTAPLSKENPPLKLFRIAQERRHRLKVPLDIKLTQRMRVDGTVKVLRGAGNQPSYRLR